MDECFFDGATSSRSTMQRDVVRKLNLTSTQTGASFIIVCEVDQQKNTIEKGVPPRI